MVGCALLGLMLDSKRYDQRRRAQMGFAVVVLPSIAWFCWLCVQQQNFLINKPAKLDWTSAGWAAAYVPFFLMQIWGYLCQTYSACCSLLTSPSWRLRGFARADRPLFPLRATEFRSFLKQSIGSSPAFPPRSRATRGKVASSDVWKRSDKVRTF